MEPFKPSTFTPFLRRFTDEKARDLSDTIALYHRVRELHEASAYATSDGEIAIGGEVWAACRDYLTGPLQQPFLGAIHDVLRQEKAIFEFPEVDFSRAHFSLQEMTDLRRFLRAKEHFLQNEGRIAPLLSDGLGRIFGAVAGMLPQSEAPSPFTVPLVNTLPEPRAFIDNLMGELWQQRYANAGLFVEIARTTYFNLCRVSNIADPYEPKKSFKRAQDFDGPLEEAVEAYLGGTPFRELFLSPVPLKFTYQERFSHMHVVGGSGAGKTTLLENLILNDLNSEDPPSLVIVDSQGDLIDKLSHLALFDPDGGRLRDRLILITPKDIEYPPAINIFDVNRARLASYGDALKEQVTAGVIQTFDYLFGGLLGADLTAKQSVFFRFVARLMLSLPETLGRNATILDMMALMDDPTPYRAAIESLPSIQKSFFERDFANKTFAQTREQIRYRLNAVLENPTLARLFTAPETKIDLFDLLNNGGVVLIDTAKDFLKGSSGHFGRIFISLVLQAVLERAAASEWSRRPIFLVVDEAAAYFDSNIDDFLTEARKYKCGCVFAHQFLDQASSSLRASLAANTAIKMAAAVSTADARTLAPDMRTTTDFILGQPRLSFACHIRNVTANAVSVPAEIGLLDRQPVLAADAFERMRKRNRNRVALTSMTRAGHKIPNVVKENSCFDSNEGLAVDPTKTSEDW